MKKRNFDFGGWATKNDLLCADGRTIRKNAFKDDDGRTVPLVWQHNHEDPTRVIGHALLENREDGVYAYCSFNNTDIAQHVKELVRHEDVNSLSIYANRLKQAGGDVLHGVIREVSVVLAGANPGAMIEFPIMEHGEESETEACIWPGEESLEFGDGMKIAHAEEEEPEEAASQEDKPEENAAEDDAAAHADTEEGLSHADKAEEKAEEPEEEENPDETIQDVLDTLNAEQKKAVEYVISQILDGETDAKKLVHADSEESEDEEEPSDQAPGKDKEKTIQDVLDTLTTKQHKVVDFLFTEAEKAREEEEGNGGEADGEEPEDKVSHSIDEGEEITMKKNVFDNDAMNEQANDTLTHAEMETIMKDARKMDSLKESVLAHSAEYGIDQIEFLFPEYKEVSGGAPSFIKRDTTWVDKVMNGVHHTPFSKVRTTFADITADEARARGYIKGTRKKEEVFSLLKRETSADTVYKLQKMDRDDKIEITSFDVVNWIKGEMRMMLDEELARAFLVGDGRAVDDPYKIKEDKIRPIFKDNDLFVIHKELEPEQGQAHGDALVDAVTYAFEDYQGTGNCTAFMTRREYSKLKLLKDKMGRRMYNNDSEIASALGVKEIVFVPAMGDESTVRVDDKTGKSYKPLCIILDLDDYNVGADKGGSVNMFDDFDIKFNQELYLIETRCSGAMVKPFAAIVIEEEVNPQ